MESGQIRVEDVGLLWIDAAGHDGEVLAGASKLLEAGVPIVTAIRHRPVHVTPRYVVLLRILDVISPRAVDRLLLRFG